MTSQIAIGIIECSKWDKYAAWVQRNSLQPQIVKLSWRENNLDEINRCRGVIFTGGEDVHPRFYGAPERVAELDSKEVNERRDEFELKILEASLKKEVPVLGICRGLQIANVYFGGTLILDIPSIGKPDHSKSEGYDRTHSVNVTPNTQLEKSLGVKRGEVNSSHHQAAEKIGRGLRVSAVSDDGIIEGLEWAVPSQKPFMLLVQWHPERMQNLESPFSKDVLFEFLQAASDRHQRLAAICLINTKGTNA